MASKDAREFENNAVEGLPPAIIVQAEAVKYANLNHRGKRFTRSNTDVISDTSLYQTLSSTAGRAVTPLTR
jgi:hypothetical protein